MSLTACCVAHAESGAIFKWAGSYESVSGKCGDLVVQESNITWGSCKQAGVTLIAVSASELVMKVDPSAVECGWAGFIVALENAEGGKKSISAYQSLEDYKTVNRFVQCSYVRKE
jgi:hypothetical protein